MGPHRRYHRGVRIIEDSLDRFVEVPDTPLRIVSLVPSLTELLWDLGAASRVRAITGFCVEPAGAWEGVARIGGPKDPDLDAIAHLAPDLVLVVKEENHARDVAWLAERGIPVYVADVRTVEDAAALIGEIGDLVDGDPAAIERLSVAVRAGIEEARAVAAAHPPISVFVPIWRDPWLHPSPDTYIFDTLEVCGARPIVLGKRDSRYPKVSLDAVRAARPGLAILPDEPYAFGPADAVELAPIAPALLVDGKELGWYGKRTAGIGTLARRIHRVHNE